MGSTYLIAYAMEKSIIVLSNDVIDAVDCISLSIDVLKLNVGRYLNIFQHPGLFLCF
ncbi:hypothetical protein D3C81_1785320 [compost metagenome]